MKRLIIGLVLAVAVVAGFRVTPVVAESLVQAAEKVGTVAKDVVVDGSAYLAGESVDVQGMVKGDVYCAGQTVTISGTVEGDVLCAGQTVAIDGTVHGDVRAAAMTITLKGTVDGSVTLAGSSVSTDSASKIGRDATITSGTINLSGGISRDGMLAGQTVVFSGTVGRDARVAADTINAASTAKIGGNLSYTSDRAADLPSGVVAGTVQHTLPDRSSGSNFTVANLIMMLLVLVVIFTVLTLVLVLVAPRYVHRVSDVFGIPRFAFLFLVGLAGMIVTPALMLILSMTVVGVGVALVLGVAVLLGLMIGGSLVAYRLGRFMLGDKATPWLSGVIGALALGTLSVIPFLGWLIMFVSTMIGFGMVIMGFKNQYEAAPTVKKLAKAPVAPKRTPRS